MDGAGADHDRDLELDEIRSTYEVYRRTGRARLWDLGNRGFRRIVEDRDRSLLRFMARSLPAAGGTVLDLGSGDGRLAVAARDAGISISSWIGVDLDPLAIARASESAPFATFIEGSADRLPLEPASVNVTVASTLFSSVPSPHLEGAIAGEISRVLASDGWLVWYDLRYDNPWNRAVHGLGRRRLAQLFPDWIGELRTITVLPPVARRLGPTTPLLYPLLESVPVLRSHLIGRLHRPASADAALAGAAPPKSGTEQLSPRGS